MKNLIKTHKYNFRGFIQGKLQKWMNAYLAITIQSILFGLAHAIPAYAMGLPVIYSVGYGLIGFFGGMLLGIAFYKTDNNIVAPWIAHAISDSPLVLLIFGT
ncbi:MAG: CPBP family intramembrane glutamic endopeptidase [Candidatus Asgardarchaeia archaeon]